MGVWDIGQILTTPIIREGWEAKALLDFYNAKTRAKEGHSRDRMGRRNRR